MIRNILFSATRQSLKPVFMTTSSQHREINAQCSSVLQASSSQQGLSTAETNQNIPVQATMQDSTSSIEKLSAANEREGKRNPSDHPQNAAFEVKILTLITHQINYLLHVEVVETCPMM